MVVGSSRNGEEAETEADQLLNNAIQDLACDKGASQTHRQGELIS